MGDGSAVTSSGSKSTSYGSISGALMAYGGGVAIGGNGGDGGDGGAGGGNTYK
jgi:hypothetical protein